MRTNEIRGSNSKKRKKKMARDVVFIMVCFRFSVFSLAHEHMFIIISLKMQDYVHFQRC